MRTKDKHPSQAQINVLALIEIGERYNQNIAKELKRSPSTILAHLQYLEHYGYVTAKHRKAPAPTVYTITQNGKRLLVFYLDFEIAKRSLDKTRKDLIALHKEQRSRAGYYRRKK